MTFELRRITPDDWRLLRDVRLRALTDAPDAFGSTRARVDGLTEAEWRSRADNGGLTLVAVDDTVDDTGDGPRGLAMGGALASDGGPTVAVWGMWTDPKARGRGIGGALLDALVAWCRDPSSRPAHDEVRLHVTQGNDAARRLYLSRGFEPTGTWEPLRDGSPLRIEELALRLRS